MSWEIFIVPVVIITIIIYRVYFVLISSSKLDELIKNYYESDKYQILLIRKLSLNEKFRYRESNDLSMFFSFRQVGPYGSFFRKQGETYFRLIVFKDANENEYQVYVEVQIMNQEILEIIEFDSYEL
jgi:hypothetical protein